MSTIFRFANKPLNKLSKDQDIQYSTRITTYSAMESNTNTLATRKDSKSKTKNESVHILEKLIEMEAKSTHGNVAKELNLNKGDKIHNPDTESESERKEQKFLQEQNNPTIESKNNVNHPEKSAQDIQYSTKRKRDTVSDPKSNTGSSRVDDTSNNIPMKVNNETNRAKLVTLPKEKNDVSAMTPASMMNNNSASKKSTISSTSTFNHANNSANGKVVSKKSDAPMTSSPNVPTLKSKPETTNTNKTDNLPKPQKQQKQSQNDKNNLQNTNETASSVKNGIQNDTNSHNKEKDINKTNPFVPLHYFGKHNKAISAVAFAPTSQYSPWTYDYTSNDSFLMDDYSISNHTGFRREKSYAICASSSADATVKVWNITNDMIAEIHEANNTHRSKKETPMDLDATNCNFPVSQQMMPLSNLVGKLLFDWIYSLFPFSSCFYLNIIFDIPGHSRGINDLAWSRTAEYIATASDDKTLRLWDVSTSDALVEFKGHTNFVFALNFNPQSNLLVSGSFDETVKIWDIRSGECVSTIPAHSDPVTAVDFNRDGTCIVSGSHDGLIRVWDTATGECLKTIYADGNPPVGYVKFSPNGKFVLAGTLDSKLRLWQIASKTTPPVNPNIPITSDNVSTSTRSSSGKPQPNNIKNYELLTKAGLYNKNAGGGKCTKTYSGHINLKYCTFSTFFVANSSRESIVSGSEDGNILLYHLQTRQVRQVLKGHEDAVLAVAAHDKKEILASGGMTIDRTVRFWVPSSASNVSPSVVT